MIARLLGLVVVVGSLASSTAEAQTPSIVYTRAVAEPAPFTFRLADVSAQWIALERDRDLSSQQILVLDAREGREVLRTPGMALPAGGTRTVMENYDLAMGPRLSADRVITFLDPQTLAAISIPDGRELWRAPVSSIVSFGTHGPRRRYAHRSAKHVLQVTAKPFLLQREGSPPGHTSHRHDSSAAPSQGSSTHWKLCDPLSKIAQI